MPKVLVAGAASILLLNSSTPLIVIWAVAVLTLLVDLSTYSRAFEKHAQLLQKHGQRYEALLGRLVEEHGMRQLIANHWAIVTKTVADELG